MYYKQKDGEVREWKGIRGWVVVLRVVRCEGMFWVIWLYFYLAWILEGVGFGKVYWKMSARTERMRSMWA